MFRVTRTTDIETCHRLHKELFPADDLYAVADAAWWLVEEVGYEAVGFAAARHLAPEGEPETVFLARAGVSKCARGNRLQRRLIRAREKWARSIGAKHMVTYTSCDNPASANSLIGEGYKLYVPSWGWAGRDVLYFRKDLV